MKKVHHNHTSYFGAANSFHGFESNFARIFSTDNFQRIYILKGGPGTGKSTLMKKVADAYGDGEYSITRIYCSSDPDSLDGVIVENERGRIAVIDGTAPHMTDPGMPGATDEIINLGEAFDTRGLIQRRDEICKLNSTKKMHYEKAYAHLKLAGAVNSMIWDVISNSASYNEAEKLIQPVLENECGRKNDGICMSDYLISSFGKNGYSRLDIPCIKKEYFSVIGDGFSEYFAMNVALKQLFNLDAISMVMHSPLTKTMTDAILTDSSVISTDKVGNHVLDSSPLLGSMPVEYEYLKGVYNSILNFAKDEFKNAADAHMALEKIYTANMHFEYNETVSERLIKEVREYLS